MITNIAKESDVKNKFEAKELENGTWAVVCDGVVIRDGFAIVLHAKKMASHLNYEVMKKVTDCCVGGCYMCDS